MRPKQLSNLREHAASSKKKLECFQHNHGVFFHEKKIANHHLSELNTLILKTLISTNALLSQASLQNSAEVQIITNLVQTLKISQPIIVSNPGKFKKPYHKALDAILSKIQESNDDLGKKIHLSIDYISLIVTFNAQNSCQVEIMASEKHRVKPFIDEIFSIINALESPQELNCYTGLLFFTHAQVLTKLHFGDAIPAKYARIQTFLEHHLKNSESLKLQRLGFISYARTLMYLPSLLPDLPQDILIPFFKHSDELMIPSQLSSYIVSCMGSCVIEYYNRLEKSNPLRSAISDCLFNIAMSIQSLQGFLQDLPHYSQPSMQNFDANFVSYNALNHSFASWESAKKYIEGIYFFQEHAIQFLPHLQSIKPGFDLRYILEHLALCQAQDTVGYLNKKQLHSLSCDAKSTEEITAHLAHTNQSLNKVFVEKLKQALSAFYTLTSNPYYQFQACAIIHAQISKLALNSSSPAIADTFFQELQHTYQNCESIIPMLSDKQIEQMRTAEQEIRKKYEIEFAPHGLLSDIQDINKFCKNNHLKQILPIYPNSNSQEDLTTLEEAVALAKILILAKVDFCNDTLPHSNAITYILCKYLQKSARPNPENSLNLMLFLHMLLDLGKFGSPQGSRQLIHNLLEQDEIAKALEASVRQLTEQALAEQQAPHHKHYANSALLLLAIIEKQGRYDLDPWIESFAKEDITTSLKTLHEKNSYNFSTSSTICNICSTPLTQLMKVKRIANPKNKVLTECTSASIYDHYIVISSIILTFSKDKKTDSLISMLSSKLQQFSPPAIQSLPWKLQLREIFYFNEYIRALNTVAYAISQTLLDPTQSRETKQPLVIASNQYLQVLMDTIRNMTDFLKNMKNQDLDVPEKENYMHALTNIHQSLALNSLTQVTIPAPKFFIETLLSEILRIRSDLKGHSQNQELMVYDDLIKWQKSIINSQGIHSIMAHEKGLLVVGKKGIQKIKAEQNFSRFSLWDLPTEALVQFTDRIDASPNQFTCIEKALEMENAANEIKTLLKLYNFDSTHPTRLQKIKFILNFIDQQKTYPILIKFISCPLTKIITLHGTNQQRDYWDEYYQSPALQADEAEEIRLLLASSKWDNKDIIDDILMHQSATPSNIPSHRQLYHRFLTDQTIVFSLKNPETEPLLKDLNNLFDAKKTNTPAVKWGKIQLKNSKKQHINAAKNTLKQLILIQKSHKTDDGKFDEGIWTMCMNQNTQYKHALYQLSYTTSSTFNLLKKQFQHELQLKKDALESAIQTTPNRQKLALYLQMCQELKTLPFSEKSDMQQNISHIALAYLSGDEILSTARTEDQLQAYQLLRKHLPYPEISNELQKAYHTSLLSLWEKTLNPIHIHDHIHYSKMLGIRPLDQAKTPESSAFFSLLAQLGENTDISSTDLLRDCSTSDRVFALISLCPALLQDKVRSSLKKRWSRSEQHIEQCKNHLYLSKWLQILPYHTPETPDENGKFSASLIALLVNKTIPSPEFINEQIQQGMSGDIIEKLIRKVADGAKITSSRIDSLLFDITKQPSLFSEHVRCAKALNVIPFTQCEANSEANLYQLLQTLNFDHIKSQSPRLQRKISNILRNSNHIKIREKLEKSFKKDYATTQSTDLNAHLQWCRELQAVPFSFPECNVNASDLKLLDELETIAANDFPETATPSPRAIEILLRCAPEQCHPAWLSAHIQVSAIDIRIHKKRINLLFGDSSKKLSIPNTFVGINELTFLHVIQSQVLMLVKTHWEKHLHELQLENFSLTLTKTSIDLKDESAVISIPYGQISSAQIPEEFKMAIEKKQSTEWSSLSEIVVKTTKNATIDLHSLLINPQQFQWYVAGGFAFLYQNKALNWPEMYRPKSLLQLGFSGDIKQLLQCLRNENIDQITQEEHFIFLRAFSSFNIKITPNVKPGMSENGISWLDLTSTDSHLSFQGQYPASATNNIKSRFIMRAFKYKKRGVVSDLQFDEWFNTWKQEMLAETAPTDAIHANDLSVLFLCFSLLGRYSYIDYELCVKTIRTLFKFSRYEHSSFINDCITHLYIMDKQGKLQDPNLPAALSVVAQWLKNYPELKKEKIAQLFNHWESFGVYPFQFNNQYLNWKQNLNEQLQLTEAAGPLTP